MPRSNALAFSNTFERATLADGETILDLTTFAWADFREFLEGRQVHSRQVLVDEAGAPDLISYRSYNTHDYWWIVCLANGVQDPFTELVPGRAIILPSISLVNEYRAREASALRFTSSRFVVLN